MAIEKRHEAADLELHDQTIIETCAAKIKIRFIL